MKKKKVYILLVTLLFCILCFASENDTKTFKINGIKYAVSVDGQEESSFPDKGTYKVSITCTGATGIWNYHEWQVEIFDINDDVSCNLEFKSTTKTTLNNYIINLLDSNTSVSSTSNNDGSTLEKINSSLVMAMNGVDATSTDYRYRGIDPNNYIWFNDELWRIIGVFDQYSHGQSGEQLVKIIRNDSIGAYIWDNDMTNSYYGDNNFPDSDIYKLLNIGYYNAINGTGVEYCYNYSTLEPAKCDFTLGGIKENNKSMIKNVTWYLGGYGTASVNPDNMYKYERGITEEFYSSGNAKIMTNTAIGLMYASDYGYAGPSTCINFLSGYSATGCSDKNWLKSNGNEWTITHYGSSSSAYSIFHINNFGSLDSDYAIQGYDIRPTLYLDSSVYYISGDGSKINPYIIAQ